MEYGFASQVLLWVIGCMTVGTTISLACALWGLGRQASRKP